LPLIQAQLDVTARDGTGKIGILIFNAPRRRKHRRCRPVDRNRIALTELVVSFSVGELAAAGVRRISLATSLYHAAMTSFLEAACEVKDTGKFGFLDRCVTTPELNKLMRS
jgi:hypothetical protein